MTQATTAPDVLADYQAVAAQHTTYAQRQRELQAKADAGAIADDELDELQRIERRLPGVAGRLQDAEAALAKHRVSFDVDALIAAWGDEEKRALYVQLLNDLLQVRQDVQRIVAHTRHQSALLAGLGLRTDDKPFELDEGTVLKNLAARMPDAMGWDMILNQPTGMLRLPLPEDLMEVDRGTHPPHETHLSQGARRLGMEIESWMSPSEKLTRARTAQGPAEKKTRPHELVVALTDEEKTELAALPLTERITRFRAILAERGTRK